MSDCFKIERGVRQGWPLSQYLFVLSVEVLTNAIQRDPVPDTTLILDGSKDILETSFDVIKKITRYLVSDLITKNRSVMDRV